MMLPISEFSRLNSCSRLEKGYLFEMYMQMLLEQKNVEYVGNPSNFRKWVKRTNTGYDIKVRISSRWIKVECKFIAKRIYRSWFLRDWDSRTADIFVTSDKFLIPFKIRYKYPRRIMTVTEFIVWISKEISKCREGNKRSLKIGKRNINKKNIFYLYIKRNDVLKYLKSHSLHANRNCSDTPASSSLAHSSPSEKLLSQSSVSNIPLGGDESMKIEKRDPRILEVSDNNPRRILPESEDLDEICKNIKTIGMLEPIIINRENQILAGQLRWLCALKNDFKEVPVIVVDTEEIAKQTGESKNVVETLISLSSDMFKFKLKADDKYRAIEQLKKEGLKVKEIAEMLGVTDRSVVKWLGRAKLPEALSSQTQITKYLRLSIRKRDLIKTILRSPHIKNNDYLKNKVLEYGLVAKVRDLQETAKDVEEGIAVDWDYRIREAKKKEKRVLVRFRVPEYIWNEFLNFLREKQIDKMKLFTGFLKWASRNPYAFETVRRYMEDNCDVKVCHC